MSILVVCACSAHNVVFNYVRTVYIYDKRHPFCVGPLEKKVPLLEMLRVEIFLQPSGSIVRN